MHDHVKSINSVTATVHEDTVKSVLLTDIRYYLLILCQQVGQVILYCNQVLLSSMKVLLLKDHRGPIYKSLSLSTRSCHIDDIVY